MEALAERTNVGQPVDHIASVASFFLSRIDTLVDSMLEKIPHDHPRYNMAQAFRGQVAIACAKVAYERYKDLFGSWRFRRLADRGARTQRLLWASTSTKDPSYSDVMYVDALIGPDTINTMPLETLEAYRDHGNPAPRLEQGTAQANQLLADLSDLGIDLDEVMLKLEDDGIRKFEEAYDKLLDALRKKGAR